MLTEGRIALFEIGPWDAGRGECIACEALKPWHAECSIRALHSTPGEFPGIVCASVFVGSRVGPEELARFPDLRLIATRSTGYDHIDLAACKERGVAVANVPAYGENTVAEHTFGLILALSRRITEAHDRVQRGHFGVEGLKGFDLYGKTLGVIGAGAIGLHVIRIGRALGMRCLAYDVKPVPLIAEVLGFEYASLDLLLAESDVVSLHAPLVPATRHLVNRETVAKMKDGALLINTARGELVEAVALIEALDSGKLRGVALDVFEGEALVAEENLLLRRQARPEQLQSVLETRALLSRENVVLTPHIGFYSEEALGRIMETTIANIRGFLSGEPRNLVG